MEGVGSVAEDLEEVDNRYWVDRVVADPPIRAAVAYLRKFRLDIAIITTNLDTT
ncbi:MAG: hypothetical protein QF812_01165 [Nitrososphaerales archaeon]|nr:hypothetical protein [Nitrososphaerales archaeon]